MKGVNIKHLKPSLLKSLLYQTWSSQKRAALSQLIRIVGHRFRKPRSADPLYHAYAVLECQPEDDIVHIKKRYKKLLTMYHPDRYFNEDKSLVDYYTHRFQMLQHAYEAIKEARSSGYSL